MKSADPKTDDGQWVYLDPFLVDRMRLNLGLSRKQLAGNASLSMNTLKEVFEGAGVRASTAGVLATRFGCKVTDLLSPRDPRYVPPTAPGPLVGESEWTTDGYLEQGRLASNGLYYIVCRMQHRHTAGRRGRGKFYHLSWLPPKIRDACREKLSRHADVCFRVGHHRQIAHNLSSTPVTGGEGWWVIDEWVGEQTLADRLTVGPWPAADLPRLLLDVAQGLAALHAVGVVFRELAPARVLIADQDGRAVLTDFELAKLLDGSPSVSSEWPEDPYRAPEVEGGSATVPSDLYSFGKLALAAAAGGLVDDATTPVVLGKAGVPKRLARYMVDCLEPFPEKRFSDFAVLLKELTRWAEKGIS